MAQRDLVRVLHFIHSLSLGGAEQQLKYLVNHSSSKIHNAICCFDSMGIEDYESGLEIFELHRKNKFDLDFREIISLMKRWRPDIVHNWLPNVMVNSFIPCRLVGVNKYLSSFRRADPIDNIVSFINIFLYLLSDSNVSNFPKRFLHFPYKQIYEINSGYFIPNGFPIRSIEKRTPRLPPGIKTHSDEYIILFVGRLSPEKNVKVIFEALRIMLRDGIECKLVICGQGHIERELKAHAKTLKILNKVYFMGFREDVYNIMKACDVLVHPSFKEGMPNVIFEAMAANLPVVVSDIPLHRYWFEHNKNALLFEPDNPYDLYEQLNKTVFEPESAENLRIQEAYKLVSTFSIDNMARRYEKLYLELGQQ